MRKNLIPLILVIAVVLNVIVVSIIGFSKSTDEPTKKNENLNATLWTQAAVEYQMSTTQAYKLAELNLMKALADKNWTAATEQKKNYQELPPAVILDIDETVLDNSPFQARLVKLNIPYNQDLWDTWVKEANADYIKGSLEFIKFVKSKGVAVFYVTNRIKDNEDPTFDNLKKLGFPVESKDELLMKNEQEKWGSDKTSRRQFVADKYRIVMLVGDDANDFVNVGKILPLDRFTKLEEYSERWGKSWIILPNPQYGSWERAAYGNNFSLTENQKLDKKIGLLDTK